METIAFKKTHLILIVINIAGKALLTESTGFDFLLVLHHRRKHYGRNFRKYHF